jgi:hypothetical protein
MEETMGNLIELASWWHTFGNLFGTFWGPYSVFLDILGHFGTLGVVDNSSYSF